ncbi:MAG: hypothetical protein R2705_24165 [Ilumatobacteraceae bacterium]
MQTARLILPTLVGGLASTSLSVGSALAIVAIPSAVLYALATRPSPPVRA